MSLFVHTTRSGDVRWQSVCKARVFCRTFGPNLFITPRLQCGMWTTEIQGFQSDIRNQVHLTRKIWFLLPCLCPLFIHKAHHSDALHRCHYVSGFVDRSHFIASTRRLDSTFVGLVASSLARTGRGNDRTRPSIGPCLSRHRWHKWHMAQRKVSIIECKLLCNTRTCQQNAAPFKFPSWRLSCSR